MNEPDEYSVSEWAIRLYYTFMAWKHRREHYPEWSEAGHETHLFWLAVARGILKSAGERGIQ